MKQEGMKYFSASLSLFHLLCVGKSLAESQNMLGWTMSRLFYSLFAQDLFAIRAVEGLSETCGILPVKNGHTALQLAEDPLQLSFPLI